jgi:hypothetical protein
VWIAYGREWGYVLKSLRAAFEIENLPHFLYSHPLSFVCIVLPEMHNGAVKK